MTVRELIEKLKDMPQDSIVLYYAPSDIPEYKLVNCVCRGTNESDGVVILDDYIEEEFE